MQVIAQPRPNSIFVKRLSPALILGDGEAFTNLGPRRGDLLLLFYVNLSFESLWSQHCVQGIPPTVLSPRCSAALMHPTPPAWFSTWRDTIDRSRIASPRLRLAELEDLLGLARRDLATRVDPERPRPSGRAPLAARLRAPHSQRRGQPWAPGRCGPAQLGPGLVLDPAVEVALLLRQVDGLLDLGRAGAGRAIRGSLAVGCEDWAGQASAGPVGPVPARPGSTAPAGGHRRGRRRNRGRAERSRHTPMHLGPPVV